MGLRNSVLARAVFLLKNHFNSSHSSRWPAWKSFNSLQWKTKLTAGNLLGNLLYSRNSECFRTSNLPEYDAEI